MRFLRRLETALTQSRKPTCRALQNIFTACSLSAYTPMHFRRYQDYEFTHYFSSILQFVFETEVCSGCLVEESVERSDSFLNRPSLAAADRQAAELVRTSSTSQTTKPKTLQLLCPKTCLGLAAVLGIYVGFNTHLWRR